MAHILSKPKQIPLTIEESIIDRFLRAEKQDLALYAALAAIIAQNNLIFNIVTTWNQGKAGAAVLAVSAVSQTA
jgi:hypothetical protein